MLQRKQLRGCRREQMTRIPCAAMRCDARFTSVPSRSHSTTVAYSDRSGGYADPASSPHSFTLLKLLLSAYPSLVPIITVNSSIQIRLPTYIYSSNQQYVMHTSFSLSPSLVRRFPPYLTGMPHLMTIANPCCMYVCSTYM